MKPKSPQLKPRCKSANINCQSANTQRAKVANIKDEGRIEFYPTLNSCRMSIKAKDEKEIRLKEIGRIQNLDNLISKLYPYPNIKSQDHTSRSRRPDGRTRRGHAPKRVARSHKNASNPRQNPRFRGKVDELESQISWASSSRTPRLSAPINIFCSATYRVVQRRAKGQKLGFLVSRLDFLFFLFSREREAYIERDTDVPFLFSAFVFSNKGNYFSFVHCSDILFFFLFSFLFLCDLLWLLMNMQVDSKSKYN